jgi:hypothetical protein
MFETKFRSYMQSLTQERPLELQQITQNPSPPPHLSSIGSTIAVPTWYPINDIMADIPCRLHIPLGRVGNKTKEVAIGMAMPGCVFHNNAISAKYGKVLVCEITNMTCIDYPLDHVMPKGIKVPGEAINQLTLRNQCEIVLDGLTMTQNQLMSSLSQMMMTKDNEASLPMSSPSVQSSRKLHFHRLQRKRKLLCYQHQLSRICPSRTLATRNKICHHHLLTTQSTSNYACTSQVLVQTQRTSSLR